MIKDVIWDFDGTLFDTYPAIAGVFLESLESFGISEDRRDVLKLLHQSLSDTYDYFSAKRLATRPTTPDMKLRSAANNNGASLSIICSACSIS